jgi:hypothetical protein
MSIEHLIQNLVLEDRFKEKYTTRQRSVFCKNMYLKINRFLLEHDKAHNQFVEQLKEDHEIVRNELDEYKKSYDILLEQRKRHVHLDIIFTIQIIACMIAIYYKVSEDISMIDTRNISSVPYNVA